jgi:hypothetical protein
MPKTTCTAPFDGVDACGDFRPGESALVVEIQEADRPLDLEPVQAASRTDPDHAAKPRGWRRHEPERELRVREGVVADEVHAHDLEIAAVAGTSCADTAVGAATDRAATTKPSASSARRWRISPTPRSSSLCRGRRGYRPRIERCPLQQQVRDVKHHRANADAHRQRRQHFLRVEPATIDVSF